MGFLTDWGFSPESWRGRRGEYWVFMQILLIIGFTLLPIARPGGFSMPEQPVIYGVWVVATGIGAIATVLLLKGVLDLGQNLTPLPHPKDDGQLVQTGVYGIIRHPLYGGLVLAALAWALFWMSLSHLLGAIVLFVFLNAKATREEDWLNEKYPDYGTYRQRVKKIIPWVY